MSKKYEYIPTDTLTIDGRTLTRIRALRDIGLSGLWAKAGDLGGYKMNHSLGHLLDYCGPLTDSLK